MTRKEQDKIRELVRDGQLDVVKAMTRQECWSCKIGILAGGDCTGRGYMEPPCVLGSIDEKDWRREQGMNESSRTTATEQADDERTNDANEA